MFFDQANLPTNTNYRQVTRSLRTPAIQQHTQFSEHVFFLFVVFFSYRCRRARRQRRNEPRTAQAKENIEHVASDRVCNRHLTTTESQGRNTSNKKIKAKEDGDFARLPPANVRGRGHGR